MYYRQGGGNGGGEEARTGRVWSGLVGGATKGDTYGNPINKGVSPPEGGPRRGEAYASVGGSPRHGETPSQEARTVGEGKGTRGEKGNRGASPPPSTEGRGS